MKAVVVLLIILFLFVFRKEIGYYYDVNVSSFNNVYVDITKPNNIRKNIYIYSSDNRTLPYIKLHQEGWKKYCLLYGYKFIFETPCLEVPVFYCKFKKILQLMTDHPNGDYFIWVDSDTIVNKKFQNFNLESMITQIGEDADIITSYYYYQQLFKALIGSFYVFKNNHGARKVLQNCLDYINFDKWTSFNKGDTLYGGKEYEEAAMFYSIKKEQGVNHKRITGKFITNSYVCDDSFFIIHNPDKKNLDNCFQKLII